MNGKYVEVKRIDRGVFELIRSNPWGPRELEARAIGAGKDDRFLLNAIELVYLASLGYKVIIDGKGVSEDELIGEVEDTQVLLVYLDLRRRGYFTRPVRNAPVDLLTWEKGRDPSRNPPQYMVKIVTEGRGIQVVDLVNILRYCEAMRAQLVLALVSSDGVVTYYKAFSFKPVKKG